MARIRQMRKVTPNTIAGAMKSVSSIADISVGTISANVHIRTSLFDISGSSAFYPRDAQHVANYCEVSVRLSHVDKWLNP